MINREDFFAALETQLRKGFPFVAYRKPLAKPLTASRDDALRVKAYLQEDSKIYKIKNYMESGFTFAPFNGVDSALLIPEEASTLMETKYPENQPQFKELKKEGLTFPPSQLEKEVRINYENLVQKAIKAIEAGKLKKVVLSRKEKIDTQLDAVTIFKALLKKYASAFVYLWFHPESGTWLGATPETLVRVDRNRFRTMALAGTQSFKGKTNISWGEKEKEEQKIVTDSILQNLQKVASGAVEKSEAYTIKAGALLHLQTDISGTLESGALNLKQIISALHPTPAVCGLPKEAARAFILENESYDREFYTGFLGEINLKGENKRNTNKRNQENQAYSSIVKQTSLYANLRCMKLKDGQAKIFVGGGITKDSDPALEWDETENKSHTIKSVLAK